MLRQSFISIGLTMCLCLTAHAADVVPATNTNILPVERSSNGAFDVLGPLIQARLSFENGQFEKSYQNYAAVFLHDPENNEVLLGLARSALAIEKNDIARKAYTKLASHDLTAKQSIEQFSGLALSDVATGMAENPEKRLKQAIELAPQDYRLWNALAQHYDNHNSWNESWNAYQKARSVGFSEAGFHNNLGMSLLTQKKYKGAASHFTYAKTLAPENIQFENNYRFALLMNGEYHAALENVSDNQAGTLLSDAGYIAMQREEYTLARTLLEKAIEVSPRYNKRAALNLEKLETRQN